MLSYMYPELDPLGIDRRKRMICHGTKEETRISYSIW
jgi:hypothetical protein